MNARRMTSSSGRRAPLRRAAVAPRRRAAVAAALVASFLLAASPGAAGAASGPYKRFVGSGVEYANNGPRWQKSDWRSRIAFRAGPGEKRLLSFTGTYSFYCGGGTDTITSRSIPVAPNGRFHARGSFVDRLSSGRVTAVSYVSIWGRLADHGNAAGVSFLVDTVYTGKHVADPYATSLKPADAACETLVKGRAAALRSGRRGRRQAKRRKRHSGGGSKGSAAPTAGALYVGEPFGTSDNKFELRIQPGARSARFVGTFIYTDPGCRGRVLANEYLTSANAPVVKIGSSGRFSGRKTHSLYVDTISGTFKGKKALTRFSETVRGCPGDRPLTLAFTMHAQ
jgi:hypothetical protein